MRQQVEDLATEEFKGRRGFVVIRREREEHANVERREAELVAGHGMYRYNLCVTVSGSSLDELEERDASGSSRRRRARCWSSSG